LPNILRQPFSFTRARQELTGVAGEIRNLAFAVAALLIAVDWVGFLWGDAHRDIAFIVAQIGFFILAHALYTKERR
jgi:EamA domain-containing membrane protein RarD